jgi:small GTP-binding protein
LIVDLAGPAYRKTVPAVVHVAMLREMLTNRVNIGVVGDGSTGKDSLIRAVFGVDTGNVNPVAGSTKDAMIYELGNTGAVQLVNYPGFNDIRKDVNDHVNDMLRYTDVFIVVVDLARGVSGTEVDILEKIKAFNRPVLVCLNKSDLPRPKDKEALLEAAFDRLTGVEMVETAFDPDPRLGSPAPVNCRAVYEWVLRMVASEGKETSHIPRSEYV